ncbi:LysR substrate-binding domain-containing protein [Streptomyces smyrnaeus]|uniref:LysR substrate-binding domain-containing protein n=1 Tax=Streptomyces TaxID=1883 RepID=UPI000C186916|nr:LysR family transcriptional regulator [Streptomyces sp. RK75]MBQ0864955.1 LysR family transcriptional regulator [Streptomyces sp. RK75]MBQ1158792.1 LysR family transcriptional regulator [Streptomyces sp. A73]
MDVHGRDLRYFVAVAEELHFTRAAERLFVSQPALSKQIRMLERTLGTPLFERDRRSVTLTRAGAVLLPYAQRGLAEWQAGRDAVEAVKAAQQAGLLIGMSTSPGRGGLLPAIRSRVTAEHPEALLTVRQFSWDDSTAGLADGTSDVAFVWLPLPEPERYRWTVVAQEPRLVALPETHRLARRAAVDFADLFDEPFLALPKSAGPLRDYWLATDARDGREPVIGTEVSSSEETYEALVGGQGVCLLARGNAPLLMRGGVVTREVLGLSPSRLAVACRVEDDRLLVHAYLRAAAGVAGL